MPAVLGDPVGVLRRHRVDHVDLARQQGRDPGRIVGDPENTPRSRLCSGLSHQFGFGTSTVLTFGWRSFSMKGPVPLAFRVAKLSSFLVRSAGFVALFFSAHSRSMMNQLLIFRIRIGSGP